MNLIFCFESPYLVYENHSLVYSCFFFKFPSNFCYYSYAEAKVGNFLLYSLFSLTLSILRKFHKFNSKSFRPIFLCRGRYLYLKIVNCGSNIFGRYKTIQIFYFLLYWFAFDGNCPFNLYHEIQ